jgi:RimJ/RimL family protein N-acetyltransferase
VKSVLEGMLIKLVALEQDHMPTIARWYGEPSFLLYANTRIPYPRSAALLEEEFLKSQSSSLFYGIVLREDGKLIGLCGLKNIDWKNRTAEFSMWIGEEEHRHQGYARDAAQVLLKLAFDELNINRVYGKVLAYNTRMSAILQQAGAVKEGVEREAVYKDGKYHDGICFSLLKREWLEMERQSIQSENSPSENQATPKAKELIERLLHGKEIEIRRNAAQVLGEMKDKQTMEPLIQALNDESEWVRWRAAQSLGKIEDDRAVESLINALYDNNWRVRLAAVQSLGRLANPKALSLLMKMVDPSHEPDEDIRKAAQEAIDRIHNSWMPA